MAKGEKLGFTCKECGNDEWIGVGETYINIYECTNCNYPELIFEHEITVKRKSKKKVVKQDDNTDQAIQNR